MGYRELPPLCARICPFVFFEVTPPGAAPGPLDKTGPVFVASGGVATNQIGVAAAVFSVYKLRERTLCGHHLHWALHAGRCLVYPP